MRALSLFLVENYEYRYMIHPSGVSSVTSSNCCSWPASRYIFIVSLHFSARGSSFDTVETVRTHTKYGFSISGQDAVGF